MWFYAEGQVGQRITLFIPLMKWSSGLFRCIISTKYEFLKRSSYDKCKRKRERSGKQTLKKSRIMCWKDVSGLSEQKIAFNERKKPKHLIGSHLKTLW